MRIKGKKIEGPNIEIIVIPRGEGDDIILRAEAVLDMSQFEELCPLPKPPRKKVPPGIEVPDLEDPEFKRQVEEHGTLRTYFMFVKSLSATEGLEWDTIKLGDPSTWKNFHQELTASGFSEVEIARITNGIVSANCLNEDRVEEARQRFLAGQRAELETRSSQMDDQKITQSGVLVRDVESNRPA